MITLLKTNDPDKFDYALKIDDYYFLISESYSKNNTTLSVILPKHIGTSYNVIPTKIDIEKAILTLLKRIDNDSL